MKLWILSDLHIEFGRYERVLPAPTGDPDVMVLAGDIGTDPERTFNWIDANRHGLPVVFTPGNHEYYGNVVTKVDTAFLRYEQENDWFYFLQDGGYRVVDKQVFTGGTLWTNFNRGDPLVMLHIAEIMSDYRVIRVTPNYRRFRPIDAYAIHRQTVKGIDDVLYQFPDAVVVTHTAPSEQCVHERFKEDTTTNHAYYTDLEGLLEKYPVKLWVHGHMHDSHNIEIHGTNIVCNPYGYAGHEENPNFDLNLVITV